MGAHDDAADASQRAAPAALIDFSPPVRTR
jgi:hypothetical protein